MCEAISRHQGQLTVAQALGLFGSGLQGATYRESLHKAIVAYNGKGGGEGAFLCRLKPTVSCARSL